MTLTLLFLHAVFTTVFGACLLRFLQPDPLEASAAVGPGFLLGFFAETMSAWGLMACGMSLGTAAGVIFAAAVLCAGWAVFRYGSRLAAVPDRLKWYEWGILGLLAAESAYAVRLIDTTPLIFSDALSVWALRGRALYEGVNWSFNPGSPVFLGFSGPAGYPLGKSIYLALNALVAGGWSDTVARFDNAILLVSMTATAWFGIMRVSGNRALASAGCFTLLSLPFLFMHSISGYADMLTGAYLGAIPACIAAGNPAAAGLLAAGAGWAKLEGFIIYLPAAIAAITAERLNRMRIRPPETAGTVRILPFLAGCTAILPWKVYLYAASNKIPPLPAAGIAAGAGILLLLCRPVMKRLHVPASVKFISAACGMLGAAWFLYSHHLGDIFTRIDLKYNPAAPGILLNMVFTDQTHTLFWGFITIAVISAVPRMLRAPNGALLLTFFFGTATAVCIIFMLTSAYGWMEEPTTIHRFLLQLYPMSCIIAFGGMGMGRAGGPAHSPSITAPPEPQPGGHHSESHMP